MDEQNNNTDNYPEHLNCIWMQSNLVSYKLCDRLYNCEDCLFDKMMRNNSLGENVSGDSFISNELINHFIEKIKNETFDNKYLFLENQLVLKHLLKNVYYVGINPLVSILLDNIKYLVWYRDSGFISKNETLLRVLGDWGEKEFIAPVSLMLFERINTSPYELASKKWFAVVSLATAEDNLKILPVNLFENEKQKLIMNLSELRFTPPEIGSYMNDGGEKIRYLYQFLGRERYKKILDQISENK